jgi:TonB family protein
MEHLQPPTINDNDTGDGEVTLDLLIDKDGDVQSYSVAKSSGSAGMDNQVIASAKESKYLPKLVHCVPVGGHYIFRFKL